MKLLYKDSCGIGKRELEKIIQGLDSYRAHLSTVVDDDNYDSFESSINLSTDKKLFDEVRSMVTEKVRSELKYIIVIGIGGSNLGTKAVYDALYGAFDAMRPSRFPKILFADTNDSEAIAAIRDVLESVGKPEEVLINAISKSGGTTETIANMEVLMEALNKRFDEANERLVITTDVGSKLWIKAKERGFATLPIPKLVGGRYSVLSSVGLFPLAAAGIDIDALRKGAHDMRTHCTKKTSHDNPAMVSAAILYKQNKEGKNINDNFIFHPELESIGKWYRQLMGESIGKQHDKNGKEVNAGITPMVSIGSTDLHSVGQLYLGGPFDKVTTFIYSKKVLPKVSVPSRQIFEGLVEGIEDTAFSSIMLAILDGVKIAYGKRGLPFMEVELHDISEKSLGEFLQFKMIEMMYLGKLLNVNTFDQPNVESYKVETKQILTS